MATVPMVAAVATDEPEMAAKRAQDRMVATASPPGQWPTQLCTAAKSRAPAPPRSNTFDIRMNSGTASRMKLSMLDISAWGMASADEPSSNSNAAPRPARTKAISTPASSRASSARRIAARDHGVSRRSSAKLANTCAAVSPSPRRDRRMKRPHGQRQGRVGVLPGRDRESHQRRRIPDAAERHRGHDGERETLRPRPRGGGEGAGEQGDADMRAFADQPRAGEEDSVDLQEAREFLDPARRRQEQVAHDDFVSDDQADDDESRRGSPGGGAACGGDGRRGPQGGGAKASAGLSRRRQALPRRRGVRPPALRLVRDRAGAAARWLGATRRARRRRGGRRSCR